MFLRNLCRVARIPTFVSGTDSNVGNMIGRYNSDFDSRVEETEKEKPWTIVNVITSKASLNSFGRWVEFKGSKGEKLNLSSFINRRDRNDLDYIELLKSLLGDDVDLSRFDHFKKLARFLIFQAKTSLPGVITLVFNHLLDLLAKNANHKDLWKAFNEKVADSLAKRKRNMVGPVGLTASAHILVFPSVDKEAIEKGVYAASLVEKHLFYYGIRGETFFNLYLKYNPNPFSSSNVNIVRDGSIYEDKCYFPELHEDFFTTFACLNMWKIGVINEDLLGNNRWTVASLYENHLKSIHKYNVEFQKTVQNSFTFELLTYWSICHSSYQDLNGRTVGEDVFKEFVKNLQRLSNIVIREIGIGKSFFTGLNNLNANLVAILKRITVPYFMRFPNSFFDVSTWDILASLGSFIDIGESFMPPDRFGWDIVFDMRFNGFSKMGLIECKYHDKAIGYAGFFNYYKKQCVKSRKYPLAFFICRKLGRQISGPNAAANLEKRISDKRRKLENLIEENMVIDETLPSVGNKSAVYEEEEFEEDLYDSEDDEKANIGASSVVNSPRVRKDYIGLLSDLWLEPTNQIDIYTVKYEEIIENDKAVEGKFTVAPLKTFLEPRGAFILVESNFTSHSPTSYS